MMNDTNIKNLIRSIGFKPTEGKQGLFYKNYPDFKYSIEIDMNKGSITYPKPIRVAHQSTSNFTSDENFVVLECINRLIEKGYAPSEIELERNFKLGHKHSGRLDINVYDKEGKSFLMIECKTFGEEFDKEIAKMHKDGGQLFSYYQQDKSTKFLCLYTSRLFGNQLEYESNIIECNELLSVAKDLKSMFKIWNRQFSNNGLFEDDASAYHFKPEAIKIGDLKQLKQEDSGKIFHGFMEILRHNVISDKPNAFNKIFNLFLCKLQDEKRLEHEVAQLQWLESDDPIKFLMRINELYAQGVNEYLGKEITNLTEENIEELVNKLSRPNSKDTAKKITEAILYKNNEFAFSDVYDERSFTQNAGIVREIVKLLQPYKICYAHKQQFLGDFFELLLNTGFKQESGQFFTPVPLTRFIINSLPIKEIIQEKLDGKSPKFLPYIIDYAMGTGHFITEAMDEIQGIINSKKLIGKDKDSQSKISIYSGKDSQFDWANEYIYGIERDYRLVKTAKVACFLHGDGLANIIHGDGLDSFKTSRDYKNLLKNSSGDKDNQKFDILVANPPYSVSAFKRTLPHGEDSFELYNHLTDQSQDIECLFIERTKQLVKEGGYAAIILPSSILSNGGIHSKAREILLRYFEIYTIAEFGTNTFMATGTNTVVLFMRRRDDNLYYDIEERVSKFMNDFQDVTSNGLENAFSNYAKSVYGMEFDDYVSLLKGNEIEHDIFKDYQKLASADSLKKFIQKKEREKLIFYILNVHVKTVVVKSGEGKIEKAFLGYEFSKRRGHEGIRIHKNADGNLTSKLYNADNRHDPERVSHYIYENGLGRPFPNVPDELVNHLAYHSLNNLIAFNVTECEKIISLNIKKKIDIRKSKYPLVKLEKGVLYTITTGVKYSKDSVSNSETNSIILTADNITIDGRFEINKQIYLKDDFLLDKKTKLQKNDVFICLSSGSKKHVGKACLITDNTNYHAGGFMGIIRVKSMILPEYFSTYFNLYARKEIQTLSLGSNINNISNKLKTLNIPLPPIEVQNDMIKRINEINNSINELPIDISEHIKALSIDAKNTYQRLGDITSFIQRGKSTEYGGNKNLIIKSGQARGFFKFNLKEKHYAKDSYKEDHRILQKGDVLINSTGVGTAGRVTLFNLDIENCSVDSHITICRPNPKMVIGDYIMIALNNIYGNKKIEQMALGQSGQIELNLETIKKLKIPLPPLEKQEKIVAKIREQQKIIEQNKIKINELEHQKQAIMSELWDD